MTTPDDVLKGLYDETLVGNAPRVLELTEEGLALGMEPQPQWLVAAVDLGLRLRAKALRFFPPRTAPYERTHPTYPNGYQLSRIGPVTMLDELNKDTNKNTNKESHVA